MTLLAQSPSSGLKPVPSDTPLYESRRPERYSGGRAVALKVWWLGCLSHICFSSSSSRLEWSLIVRYLGATGKGPESLGSGGRGYGWLAEKMGHLHYPRSALLVSLCKLSMVMRAGLALDDCDCDCEVLCNKSRRYFFK